MVEESASTIDNSNGNEIENKEQSSKVIDNMKGKLLTVFKCDTCDCTMTGQQSYDDHVRGKKHLTKVARSCVNGSLPKEAPGEGGTWSCQMCDLLNVSSTVYLDHISGKKHLRKVADQEAGQDSIKKSSSVVVAHRCDICDLEFTGTVPYNDHIKGKKHKAKVRETEATKTLVSTKSEGENSSVSSDLKCDVCNCNFTSRDTKIQHLNGKRHRNNVRQGGAVKVAGRSNNYYTCELCGGVTFTSLKVYNSHQLGSKHLGKVLERGDLNNEPLDLSTAVGVRLLENEETYFCDLCQEVLEHSLAAKVHVGMSKHKMRVEFTLSEDQNKKAGLLYCRFCDYIATDDDDMNDHRSSDSHRAKSNESSKAPSPPHTAAAAKPPANEQVSDPAVSIEQSLRCMIRPMAEMIAEVATKRLKTDDYSS